ncbi:hypothetical protein [Flavobacterium quisquiliarum]|jgi:hypothetical protein|uniref:Chain length determinant protein n=1 Tax=Flavobacterium quisquiliarum TaxID=1834436 RepID=A0ABV8WCH0_9FLAO|nr:hypothetical protein [Flavobacterium quisquiliarum]MBW1657430.1 hypothetical protein [Flavobacterium quisquiliarum]NWK99413.1 hypothetical protein [Flavobacterium collinsii]
MSTKVPQNIEDQEVDLGVISKNISDFFGRINSAIFNSIQFFVRNWIIVLILIVTGFGLGMFLDKIQKSYRHEIIVAPNFGSTDYLYAKVDLINSKIKENDTLFLKEVVGIPNPKNLKIIELKPIADVYNFIQNKPENFELIKLMAEDGDIKKVLEENVTSKNYNYQTLLLFTNNKVTEEKLIIPLLKYLNTSDYYSKIQKVVYHNVELKIQQTDSIIKQIDGILNNLSNSSKGSLKNDKLIYYNENTQLNDIIKSKNALLNEQAAHKVELIGFDKIIKENNVILNLQLVKFVSGNLKFLLPLIFILGFIFLRFFKSFYKKQKHLAGL